MFDVIDIADWPVVSQEAGGAEMKDWVCPPGSETSDSRSDWWLFKKAKVGALLGLGGVPAGTYRRFDDVAERVAAALAELIGLPAAQVELAHTDQASGIISRNIAPHGWSIQGGDVALSEMPNYVSCQSQPRPKNRKGHNLGNIGAVLDGCTGPPGLYESTPALVVFAGYLMFDAWIANTDRHAMNWAIPEKSGVRTLAPSFDHGSALASGDEDDRLDRLDVAAYCAHAYARSFEDGRKVTLVALAHQAVNLAGPAASEWMARLAGVDEDTVGGVVHAVPDLTEVRRRFMTQMLMENRRRLLT